MVALEDACSFANAKNDEARSHDTQYCGWNRRHGQHNLLGARQAITRYFFVISFLLARHGVKGIELIAMQLFPALRLRVV